MIGVIPPLLKYDFEIDSENIKDIENVKIPLQVAIASLHHQFSMVASLAAFSPIVLELLVDSYTSTKSGRSLPYVFSIWSLTLSVIIPNSLVLFDLDAFAHSRNCQYIPWIFNFRAIITATALFSVVSEYGAPIWSNFNTTAILLSYIVSTVIGCFRAFHTTSVVSLSTIQDIGYYIATLLLLWMSIRWVRFLLRHKKLSMVSFQEFSCSLHLIGVYVAFLGFWVIFALFASAEWAESSVEYVTSFNYVLSTIGLLVVAFDGRITRGEIILEQKYTEGRQDWFDIISDTEKSVEMAVDILNSILTYERLTNKLLELQKMPLAIKPFISECVRPFIRQARENGLDLKLEFQFDATSNSNSNSNTTSSTSSPQLLFVNGDPKKLEQVISHIVTNAIKYSKVQGTVIVRVSYIHVTDIMSKNDESVTTTATTTTTTPGVIASTTSIYNIFGFKARLKSMSTRASARVSSSQYFAPNTIRIEVIDNGLGITKIISMHEGRLWTSSEGSGHGSTFTIDLPMYVQPVTANGDVNVNVNVKTGNEVMELSTKRRASSLSVLIGTSKPASRASANSIVLETVSSKVHININNNSLSTNVFRTER
eukprot:gene10816-22565_t